MKRKTESFSGSRPIFNGSPSLVTGGFNLDVTNQKFNVGDLIPAGTLAIRDEEKRTVQVIKTAKVAAIDSENAKKISLLVDEFYSPIFVIGEKVLKTISGTYANAPQITAIESTDKSYTITLDKEISGLTVGDFLEEVIADSSANAKSRGLANSVLVSDNEVTEFETSIDVCADTMQYEMYERRVPAIPTSQKDDTGMYLKGNIHIKLSKSK